MNLCFLLSVEEAVRLASLTAAAEGVLADAGWRRRCLSFAAIAHSP